MGCNDGSANWLACEAEAVMNKVQFETDPSSP